MQCGDYSHTTKNAQVVTALLTSCNNLLQHADIRMRSHGLRQFVDDKSVASCRHIHLLQVNCRNLLSTGLLQQVVTSRQITNCNKPDFNMLVATG